MSFSGFIVYWNQNSGFTEPFISDGNPLYKFLMTMKRVLLSTLILFCSFQVTAQAPDTPPKNKFLLGAQAGINNFVLPVGDFYFAYDFRLKHTRLLARVGYAFKSGEVDFRRVEDMVYSSHGNFVDLNIFISEQMYFGLGLSVHVNVVHKDDQHRYRSITERTPPGWFMGIMTTAQLGYMADLGPRFRFNIEGEAALHSFVEEDAIGYPISQTFPSPASRTTRILLLGQLTVGVAYVLNK